MSYAVYKENPMSLNKVIAPYPIYYPQALSGQTFTLTLDATTSGVAAGNVKGAAAAAATQFALINPAGSNRNLVLMKFFVGVISGTPGAGPMFHSYFTTLPSAASPGGTVRNNLLGSSITSVAKPWALAAGSAMTGGSQPITFRVANFASTGTAQASAFLVSSMEFIDGDIIIPPGIGWVPMWSGAGTSLLNGYSVTWYETGL